MSVNEAYEIVSQEESQRLLGVVDVNKDPLTMLAGITHQVLKPKRPSVICEHRGYKGHLRKIVGYPQDFKSKKKRAQSGRFRPFANSTVVGENMNSSKAQGHFFTEQQYQQILNMLNKPTSSDNADNIAGNMAGMTSLLSNNFACEWIIDTGSSHHITPYKELLTTFRTPRDQNSSRFQVPTGGRAEITSIGDAMILGSYMLENVLHVPDFKFNLLSVSKITKTTFLCGFCFFLIFMCFRDSTMGRFWGLVKKRKDCTYCKRQ